MPDKSKNTGPRKGLIRVRKHIQRRVKSASALEGKSMAEFTERALRRELDERDAERQKQTAQ
jgi:predicted HicB family RNase H-like nuclease